MRLVILESPSYAFAQVKANIDLRLGLSPLLTTLLLLLVKALIDVEKSEA